MIDKQAILDEIQQFANTDVERIQPGDLTYAEIEEALGIKHDKAQALMLKLIKAGKFRRIEAIGSGFKCVFRKIE